MENNHVRKSNIRNEQNIKQSERFVCRENRLEIIDYFNKDYHGVFADQSCNSRIKRYYKSQLSILAKNKVVVDLGAGNGVLSLLAVQAGAKKVYAIEKNSILCNSLTQEINRLGWQNYIEIVNADFILDDLSEFYQKSDICVSETINNSIYNNIFPKLMSDIKAAHRHLIMIPENFQWSINIVENPHLTKKINWNYDKDINTVLDNICLDIMVKQPMKLFKFNLNQQKTLTSKVILSYNFNQERKEIHQLKLPTNRNNKWIEIFWSIEDDVIYDNFWQREYIPLWINYFNNSDSITIRPFDYYHLLETN